VLVKIQGRKALHLNQLWCEIAVCIAADTEIQLKEHGVLVLARYGQVCGQSRLALGLEVGLGQDVANVLNALEQFALERERHEDGRFADSEGARLPERGVHGVQEGFVFFRAKRGVEGAAYLLVHCFFF
jgi:hypothetical protein